MNPQPIATYQLKPRPEGVLLEFFDANSRLIFSGILSTPGLRHIARNGLMLCDFVDQRDGRLPNEFIEKPYMGVSEVKTFPKVTLRGKASVAASFLGKKK